MRPSSFFSQQCLRQQGFSSLSNKKIGELCIIRHAKSEHNEKGFCAGFYNRSRLTNDGVDATYKAGKLLFASKIKFNSLYVSPLDRAVTTAKILLNNLPATQMTISEALAERNFGAFSGMSKNEIKEILSCEAFSQYIHDRNFFPPDIAPGHKHYQSKELYGSWPNNHKGESYQCVINRLKPFLEKLKQELLDGQNILIVGHSHSLQILQMLLYAGIFEQGIAQYKIDHVTPIKYMFSLGSNNQLMVTQRVNLAKSTSLVKQLESIEADSIDLSFTR